MLKVLRDKNFFLLFQGAFVSEIGNMLYNLAMSLFIYEITDNSAIAMGIYLAIATFTRVLVSPVAGVLVDRLNRIRIVYITDFIRGFLFFGLLYIIINDLFSEHTILIVYIVTIISSINAAFFFPAVASAIPEIVGEDRIQEAQGARSFLSSIPQIIGAVFGAALYDYLGIEVIILINAISFLISGLSEMFIRTPFRIEREVENRPIMKDYVDSLKYIKKLKLSTLILFFLLINFAIAPIFSVANPVLFKGILMRENTMEYAMIGVIFNIAMMIASIVISSLKLKSYRLVIRRGVGFLLFVVASIGTLFHLVSNGYLNYWLFYGLYSVIAIMLSVNLIFINIPVSVGLTLSVSSEMRGRVFSTTGALTQLAIPFSIMMGSAILEYSTISMLGLVSCFLLLIPTLGFVSNKKINELLYNLDEQRKELATT
jgi:MFS family permease